MTKVVVVGAGMAATRLIERISERDDDHGLQVVVIGAERQLPYNRVLLSAALTDPRRLHELTFRTSSWYRKENVELVRATRVAAIDRRSRTVTCAGGRAYCYDKLVLATGANPILPQIRGIVTAQGRLHPAVSTFRSYDDCRRLLAGTAHARRAVVIGGGLLGLEAARGLIARGLDVDIVHAGAHLMHDHLDADGADVLRRHVEALGIGVHTGLHVSAALAAGDQLHSLKLSDGYLLDGDLAVIACGSRPAVRLAVAAGIATHRGVVVDDQLRSVDDESIYAVGDCAEHRGVTGNQAWTAWAQADVLASLLVGDDTHYVADQRAVRLRAAGIDVAALGEPVADETAQTSVVRLHNPVRGSYKRLAFRQNRLVGGVLVGDTEGAAALVAALDRPWLPASPAALLLGTAIAAARRESTDATTLPDEATVCACNGVTAGQLRAAAHSVAADAGPAALGDVVRATRATTGCGGCKATVTSIVSTSSPTPVSMS